MPYVYRVIDQQGAGSQRSVVGGEATDVETVIAITEDQREARRIADTKCEHGPRIERTDPQGNVLVFTPHEPTSTDIARAAGPDGVGVKNLDRWHGVREDAGEFQKPKRATLRSGKKSPGKRTSIPRKKPVA